MVQILSVKYLPTPRPGFGPPRHHIDLGTQPVGTSHRCRYKTGGDDATCGQCATATLFHSHSEYRSGVGFCVFRARWLFTRAPIGSSLATTFVHGEQPANLEEGLALAAKRRHLGPRRRGGWTASPMASKHLQRIDEIEDPRQYRDETTPPMTLKRACAGEPTPPSSGVGRVLF